MRLPCKFNSTKTSSCVRYAFEALFVNGNTLRTINLAIFSSIVSYGSIIGGQIQNRYTEWICRLQDKEIRITNAYNDFQNPLYNNLCILKFKDQL